MVKTFEHQGPPPSLPPQHLQPVPVAPPLPTFQHQIEQLTFDPLTAQIDVQGSGRMGHPLPVAAPAQNFLRQK